MFVTGLNVTFTQPQYTGSEEEGFVLVTLELVGGTSSRSFNVTVTPLEQSSVSAEGKKLTLFKSEFQQGVVGRHRIM